LCAASSSIKSLSAYDDAGFDVGDDLDQAVGLQHAELVSDLQNKPFFQEALITGPFGTAGERTSCSFSSISDLYFLQGRPAPLCLSCTRGVSGRARRSRCGAPGVCAVHTASYTGCVSLTENPVLIESTLGYRIVGCTGGEGDHEHDVAWYARPSVVAGHALLPGSTRACSFVRYLARALPETAILIILEQQGTSCFLRGPALAGLSSTPGARWRATAAARSSHWSIPSRRPLRCVMIFLGIAGAVQNGLPSYLVGHTHHG
jgi:hypothetical protein